MANGPPGLEESRRETPIGPPSKGIEQISRELDIARARSEFFPGRDDVSDERAFKRMQQADELQRFKNLYTKPVKGSSNLLQMKDSALRFDTDSSSPTFGQYVRTTVADKAGELANKYGPTLGEIAGDFTRAVGDTLGSVAEGFLSGKVGIMAGIKAVGDYAKNKVNDGYNKLNDVQKEIYDNPDKHPLTSKNLPAINVINNNERLALEAQKDSASLGLELDTLLEQNEKARQEAFLRAPGAGYQAGVGLTALPTPEISIDFPTRDPVFPAEQIKQSALDRFSPEYLEQQKALLDELNISPQVAELLDPNAPGGREQQFRIDPQDQDEGGTQVTAFNNPVNLTDVGQAGTTGETYGNNFAVFPNAETGILAAKRDLALKTDRYDGSVDKIIGEFSPREDNPDSFDNYVNFVKQGVGDRVDPGEEDELLKRVIQFENKPDIAQQYLALVAEGGLMDKKMYGGIIASKG
jgi:hypothetical protein|tara:strand:- start:235 stop:1635 length:1401 start_codon:yes stop_codon:yes gene_type:complete